VSLCQDHVTYQGHVVVWPCIRTMSVVSGQCRLYQDNVGCIGAISVVSRPCQFYRGNLCWIRAMMVVSGPGRLYQLQGYCIIAAPAVPGPCHCNRAISVVSATCLLFLGLWWLCQGHVGSYFIFSLFSLFPPPVKFCDCSWHLHNKLILSNKLNLIKVNHYY